MSDQKMGRYSCQTCPYPPRRVQALELRCPICNGAMRAHYAGTLQRGVVVGHVHHFECVGYPLRCRGWRNASGYRIVDPIGLECPECEGNDWPHTLAHEGKP